MFLFFYLVAVVALGTVAGQLLLILGLEAYNRYLDYKLAPAREEARKRYEDFIQRLNGEITAGDEPVEVPKSQLN